MSNLKEKAAEVIIEFDLINKQLETPEVIEDNQKYSSLSKKAAKLSKKVDLSIKYVSLLDEIDEANEILSNETDEEFINSLNETISSDKIELDNITESLENLIYRSDPNDDLDAIVEIEGKAGGDEANLFAGDLFRMYQRYASKEGFKIEIIEESPTNQGGYSNIIFEVIGTGAYGKLRNESGIHRVQRVPQTESQGRVHTSTASVVALPKVDSDINVDINPSDLRIDTYRASGSGGQHVNKTDSAIRITHIPSGIVTQSQDGRSQHANKETAMGLLKSKLLDMQIQEEHNRKSTAKKNIVGTGDRSEKIRTYNYPQNRVTDHRINFTLKKLDRVMDGDLSEIIEAIQIYLRESDDES